MTKYKTGVVRGRRYWSATPSKPKPALIDSDELCRQLVCMAAFSLYDQPKAQKLVYEAVRKLQRMDALAREAGRPGL